VHAASEVLPVAVLYFPAAQFVQALVVPEPEREYEPAAHCPPGVPSAVVEPARQYLPASQGKHADSAVLPRAALYFPAAHCLHENHPALEYDPAGHCS
jgi:hypothetical protein